jgi:heme/copper-type cytochrome/quinol oxidase subunit 2
MDGPLTCDVCASPVGPDADDGGAGVADVIDEGEALGDAAFFIAVEEVTVLDDDPVQFQLDAADVYCHDHLPETAYDATATSDSGD